MEGFYIKLLIPGFLAEYFPITLQDREQFVLDIILDHFDGNKNVYRKMGMVKSERKTAANRITIIKARAALKAKRQKKKQSNSTSLLLSL